MTARLARLCLQVQDFSDLHDFYGNLMGMQHFESEAALLLGFDDKCLLEFQDSAQEPYTPNEHDLYWKIGITLRDLDAAVSFLRARNYSVTDPHQFRDIGYMCHLKDPKGFTIELLQQRATGDTKTAGSGHPIGAQATLAHLTLRVTDIKRARVYCEDKLGMQLIAIQPVNDLGFCLYFFSGSKERPPNENLQSVKNREWLWTRPDMLLELQHLYDESVTILKPQAQSSGFSGMAYQPETPHTMTTLSPQQLWNTD